VLVIILDRGLAGGEAIKIIFDTLHGICAIVEKSQNKISGEY
jgi:hypothetical protein